MNKRKPSPCAVDFQYQGPDGRAAYFEGWYFKFSLGLDSTLSLIPSLHKKGPTIMGNLQWILRSGTTVTTRSISYPSDRLSLRRVPFALGLGPNIFHEYGLRIQEQELDVQADFKSLRHFTKDIMGPFRPLHRQMPCSHGLLVTNGAAELSIRSPHLSGTFASGLYVEKDWGDTFPERYIWIHADFPEQRSSFFFSIARVKVGPAAFPGFIANLVLDGTDHTFATWNLAQCRVTGHAGDIRIALSNKDIRLTLRILPQQTVRLDSPVEGLMTSTIRESLAAPIRMIVEDTDGKIIRLSSPSASVEHHEWFQEPPKPRR